MSNQDAEMSVDSRFAVTIKEAKSLVKDAILIGRTPMVLGKPGSGKSVMVHGLAEEDNLLLLDERLSTYAPEDASGLPNFNEDKTKARFIPMENFPLETDEIPVNEKLFRETMDGFIEEGRITKDDLLEGAATQADWYLEARDRCRYSGWLLFLDEFTAAPRNVQAAVYKLVLDRKVGNANLHPKVQMVAAGNRITDNAVAGKLGTAMQSRVIHYEIKTNYKEWLMFAYGADFDHRVTSYINYKPTSLNNFDPKHKDKTFACERTWEFMSDFLKLWGEEVPLSKLPTIVGTIGEAVGQDFFSYCQCYKDLPKIEDILKNPDTTKVPSTAMNQWAVSGALGPRIDKSNVDKIMTYLDRMELQFQTMALRIALPKDPSLLQNKTIRAFVNRNAVAMV